MKRAVFLIFGLAGFAVTGCNNSQDRLKEVSDIQAKSAADNQVSAENAYLVRRAAEMEEELARRHSYYQAVSGTYEGTMTDGAGTSLSVRFTFTPSAPPYQPKRLRTLEEIAEDLGNLYLNVEVVQWNPSGSVVFGCVFERIRPDLTTGLTNLVSSSCGSVYSLRLADSETPGTPGGLVSADVGAKLVTEVLSGRRTMIPELQGQRQSVTKSSLYRFSVKRVGEVTPLPENAIAATDEDTAKRILQMEADLERRQRFYQALSGTYEGSFRTKDGDFGVKLTLVPSLPVYSSRAAGRLRTVEEITSDLMNLSFNVQSLQWRLGNTQSGVGCQVEGVRPDLVAGKINVASSNCRSVVLLRLSEAPGAGERGSDVESALVAGKVLDGTRPSVENLVGRLQSTTNAESYEFTVSKVLR